MDEVKGVTSIPELESRAELGAVLASPAFVRSPRMGKLLEYLCERYFEGQADSIKEYSIAVEVLGRPESFDPTEDAIARVEVHRLRRKLREYYEQEGASNRLRIVIPPGKYTPTFALASQTETAVESAGGAAVQTNPMLIDVPPAPVGQPNRRWMPVAIGALILAVLVGTGLWLRCGLRDLRRPCAQPRQRIRRPARQPVRLQSPARMFAFCAGSGSRIPIAWGTSGARTRISTEAATPSGPGASWRAPWTRRFFRTRAAEISAITSR